MLHYQRIDVFTSKPFGGNPLAVFLNVSDLTDEQMQQIAKEFNLSEVTFVFPPDKGDNHYKVRIFTPATEMPMAGHPTIGTAFALLREGMISAPGTVRFEEPIGVIEVTLSQVGDFLLISMQQPNPEFGDVLDDREAVAAMLSLDPADLLEEQPVQVVSCGVPFLYVPVKSLKVIRRIRPRIDLWERLREEHQIPDGIFVFTMETELPGSTVHARMFAPGLGISEDPATGAASGPLGAYLVQNGLVKAGEVTSIISEQGIEMGRPSIIQIRIEREGDRIVDVDVGGRCVFMGTGMLQITN